jgi:phage terminase large subunit-like protein
LGSNRLLPSCGKEVFRFAGPDTVALDSGFIVEATIRTARRHAPIKLLNASRGKVQRAEPIVALYAQGKVRHDA